MVIEWYAQRRTSLARKHKECLPCYREVCQVLHLATCKGRRVIPHEYREIDFLHTCSNRRVTARKLGPRKAWIQAFTVLPLVLPDGRLTPALSMQWRGLG